MAPSLCRGQKAMGAVSMLINQHPHPPPGCRLTPDPRPPARLSLGDKPVASVSSSQLTLFLLFLSWSGASVAGTVGMPPVLSTKIEAPLKEDLVFLYPPSPVPGHVCTLISTNECPQLNPNSCPCKLQPASCHLEFIYLFRIFQKNEITLCLFCLASFAEHSIFRIH